MLIFSYTCIKLCSRTKSLQELINQNCNLIFVSFPFHLIIKFKLSTKSCIWFSWIDSHTFHSLNTTKKPKHSATNNLSYAFVSEYKHMISSWYKILMLEKEFCELSTFFLLFIFLLFFSLFSFFFILLIFHFLFCIFCNTPCLFSYFCGKFNIVCDKDIVKNSTWFYLKWKVLDIYE